MYVISTVKIPARIDYWQLQVKVTNLSQKINVFSLYINLTNLVP